jgi:hypothetical protein
MDKEPENDIEFFGANDGYAVNSFGGWKRIFCLLISALSVD